MNRTFPSFVHLFVVVVVVVGNCTNTSFMCLSNSPLLISLLNDVDHFSKSNKLNSFRTYFSCRNYDTNTLWIGASGMKVVKMSIEHGICCCLNVSEIIEMSNIPYPCEEFACNNVYLNGCWLQLNVFNDGKFKEFTPIHYISNLYLHIHIIIKHSTGWWLSI